jgi:O-antigen biosynthesis protein
VLLAGYSLLPEHYRFSRAIILLGAILSFILIGLLRRWLIAANVLTSGKHEEEDATTLIIGSAKEYGEAVQLMKEAGMHEKVLGRVAVTENDPSAIGYWARLDMLRQAVPFREAVFCEGALSFKNIIDAYQQSAGAIKIKIHAAGSHSIVGSDSKKSSGEAVSKENGFKLADPYNRRLKRLQDMIVAVLALASFPIHFLAIRKPLRFFANCFSVFFAQKTWVGYTSGGKNLPPLRQAVITCNGTPATMKQQLPPESLQMVDYWYARDYKPSQDIKIIYRAYRRLGG